MSIEYVFNCILNKNEKSEVITNLKEISRGSNINNKIRRSLKEYVSKNIRHRDNAVIK